jgi:hypothetical protein
MDVARKRMVLFLTLGVVKKYTGRGMSVIGTRYQATVMKKLLGPLFCVYMCNSEL